MVLRRPNVAMAELEYLPQLSPSLQALCVTLYLAVGVVAFTRSFQMRPRLLTRQKVFQYLVTTFCCMRSLSLLTTPVAVRDVLNRTALCLFFSLMLFQVFFWFDVVNPSSSARSKRVWHSFLYINIILYTVVGMLELDLLLVTKAPTDAASYWSDMLPVLLVALGSLLLSIGLLFSICKMRMRVQRLMNEHDASLSTRSIARVHRALCYLNCIFAASSCLFLLRAVLYLQHPWAHKECGSIQDPNWCLGVGYVLPELIPCCFFVLVMWDVDPNLWRSRMSTGETTPLLGKSIGYTSGFGKDLRWHRPSPLLALTTPTTEPYLRARAVTPHTSPANVSVQPTPPGLLDALWLSFQCFQLKHGGADVHASLVILHMLQDGVDDIELGRTELAHTTDPSFHVMIKVPLDAAHLLRIRVYSVRNWNTLADLSSQNLVGDAMLRPLEIGQCQLYRLSSSFRGDMCVSNTGLLVVRCEAAATMDTAACITRGFLMDKVLVEEELVESPWTYEIPYQMLQLIQADLVQKANWMAQVLQANRTSLLHMPSDDDGDDPPTSTHSLLTEMIYQLQGNARKRTNRKWRGRMLEDMEAYIGVVQDALDAYGHPDKFGLSFKPSTKKADAELRFVALNMHVQLLTLGAAVPMASPLVASIDEEKEAEWHDDVKVPSPTALDGIFAGHQLMGTTTVGAFAAHVYGFGQGGIRQLREDLERLRERSLKATDWSDNTTQALQRDMYALEWHIDQRLDVAFTQAVSALVPCFQHTLFAHLHTSAPGLPPAAYLARLQTAGFLFNVESLLSTVGSEAGMLGDMDAAVKALAYVQIRLRCVPDAASAAFAVAISTCPQGLVVELPIIMSNNYTLAPSMHRVPGQDLASGAVYCPVPLPGSNPRGLVIKVVPVLFTQGMNELQTVANTVRKSQLQHAINQESANVLQAYLTAVYAPADVLAVWEEAKHEIFTTKDEKCMAILEKTSWVVRQVGGGRVTCCKSAKDRTAMSVTLEQAKVMGGDVPMWTQLLRTYGVRRENARKNIGTAQYCFSSWQNYLLPPAYKCPPGTGGGSRAHS
ncbi:type I inositol-3,4-bisphosphate 4-phosphatase [Achlya hypogyna]|uniref:Type I inositol-3,4-bisphosphate 4-phosphatase n=1 Tax=Achlya hypogyna TaxID=1202772 RepID=A0A1V9ZN99_ACHHY|nr:type I inositol-3,4-bisphosphate 4-phosphatase [Achlya hypogyna]